MKVIIDDFTFSPEQFPIAIILTKKDKQNLAKMDKKATVIAFITEKSFETKEQQEQWLNNAKSISDNS